MLIQHYLEAARPYLERYGYASVFAGVLVEGFGIPAPGQTLIIAGAILASEGQLNILILLIVAWTAAVMGDNIGYAIGHLGSRVAIKKTWLARNAPRMESAQRFFRKYGGGIVVVSRFFDILRQLNGIVAGSIGMSWRRFFAFNSIGAALWVTVWGLGVYLFGLHMEQILVFFKRFEPYAIGTGLLILTFFLIFLLLGRKIKTPKF